MTAKAGCRGTVAERMARKYTVDPATGCWNWHGSMDTKGYGQMRVDGRNRFATHLALELGGRPRPADKRCALHRCDNPACVNPAHLWWGTMRENTRDMMAKGRQNLSGFALGRQPRGHRDVIKPPVVCDHCGVNFRTSRAQKTNNKRHFCSTTCCWTWQRDHFGGQKKADFAAINAQGFPFIDRVGVL